MIFYLAHFSLSRGLQLLLLNRFEGSYIFQQHFVRLDTRALFAVLETRQVEGLYKFLGRRQLVDWTFLRISSLIFSRATLVFAVALSTLNSIVLLLGQSLFKFAEVAREHYCF